MHWTLRSCALPIDDPAALPAATSSVLSSLECVRDRRRAIELQLPSEAARDRRAESAGFLADRLANHDELPTTRTDKRT
jgi:hypothetical protein